MSHTHIVQAYDQELKTLTDSIAAMGDFAGAQLADAVQALLQGNLALAQRVIDQDRLLDALRRDLSTSAALVIARRQPLAGDLDEVLSDFRIVEDLERIGDLAKNIAKRATAVAGTVFPDDVVQSLRNLALQASEQLRKALAAFVARDAEAALAIRQHDETIDELHTTVFRDLVARMGSEQAHVIGFVHLLFCAKNIERIGDHATHIAEAAYLRATGEHLHIERRRLDDSSTLTDDSLADK